MSGSAARSTLTLALALLAVALTASGGTAATAAHGPLLGVIPHAGARSAPLTTAAAITPTGPVVYHDGQVMHQNTTYAIYWAPSGHPISPSYESLVNRYLADVAAASGSSSNVYSVATQYYDTSAPIQYASQFGGSYVDTKAFPANGCNDHQDAVCLTDQQLQAEIQRVLTTNGWHGSASTMFFLLTPSGVGSCFDAAGTQCTTNSYCAYHSDFFDTNGEHVIYANQPYDGSIAGCSDAGAGQGFPNGHDADATINAISHEHNEALTDPFGDGWFADDGAGDEVADLCVGNFGTSLGTLNGQPFNQVINGHDYSLQLEYSNDNGGCVSSYAPTSAPVEVSAPVLSGSAGLGQVLSASTGAWTHGPTGYAYQWQRCTASGAGCANIPGAAAASYELTAADVGQTVRAEVSAHNAIGASGFVASAVSGVVVSAPSSTGAPVLTGVAAVGKRLTSTAGAWNTQVTVAYSWLRCSATGARCSTIGGASSSRYVVRKADRGHTLETRVLAMNVAGAATGFSTHSAVVEGAPIAKEAPHVSGRVHLGRRLSATSGSWSDAPTRFRFQWLRCNVRGGSCVRIHGATRARYRLTTRDVRHKLRVRVTATNIAGAGRATSQATPSVAH